MEAQQGLTCSRHCFLLLTNRGRGFKGYADHDVLTVGNTSLNATASIRAGSKSIYK